MGLVRDAVTVLAAKQNKVRSRLIQYFYCTLFCTFQWSCIKIWTHFRTVDLHDPFFCSDFTNVQYIILVHPCLWWVGESCMLIFCSQTETFAYASKLFPLYTCSHNWIKIPHTSISSIKSARVVLLFSLKYRNACDQRQHPFKDFYGTGEINSFTESIVKIWVH
jgi:hypothetical protein